MNTKALIIVFAAIGSMAALWVAHSRFVELELVRDQLAVEVRARNRSVLVGPEIESLKALISAREKQIAQLEAEAVLDSSVPDSLRENSVEIEEWLKRIDRLSEYLSTRSDLQIPEMEYLTPSDWLGVTNSVTLDTEADYRVALAHLRRQAKFQIAPKILATLGEYLKASNDEPPSSIAELFEYADSTLGREILERYRVNPSGEISTMRTNGKILLVESSGPDELWDTTFSFASNGSFLFQGNTDTDSIENAIALFEEEYDRKPESGKELEPFVENRFDSQQLDEKLRAMNTRVEL